MLELKQGTQLADRYSLVRRLGGDGDAHTWLARDKFTHTSVALKIVAGDAARTANLRAEWQTSIRMVHAHIVRVFEFHEDQGVAFYSQQFVDGVDIGALAGQTVDNILGPIGLLLDALAYVHGKGFVHRDVKASNVLLDGNGAPYLTDFGIAVGVGQAVTGGTPVAQSPESQAGDAASPADDIFALGVLIYELISGHPPSSPATPLLDNNGAELAPALQSLVADMLGAAEHRPSAEDAAARLRAAGYLPHSARIEKVARPARSDESVQSIRPVSRAAQATEAVTQSDSGGLNPKIVAAALLVLILVLAGVIFVLPDNVAQKGGPVVDLAPVATGDDGISAPVVVDDRSKQRRKLKVDPEVRQRVTGSRSAPSRKLEDDDDITFSENEADYSGFNELARKRFNAESTLGELLSALEVLEARGVEMWASREYRDAKNYYAEGDKAYLEKDYEWAEELYLASLTVLEPLYARIEPTFQKALADARAAFDAGDRSTALEKYELAVAITSTHPEAVAGYERAKNLERVLQLVEQGLAYEKQLDLDAAQRSFEQAVTLDPLWQPAQQGIERVQATRTKIEFDTRMSEGFEAIAAGDYLGARAAFRVAEKLIPGTAETADGMLQVDQGLRLGSIGTLEQEALALQDDEHWDAVVSTYEEILKVDDTLAFAHEGLQHAKQMAALHSRLDKLVAEPDRLSVPAVMQDATSLIVNITTRADVGPRLAAQRDDLSRLLKRAATPVTIPLLSDNVTDVFVYKVGRLGNFMRREIQLRPGTYVVVGSRPGYRDVRKEFRVAPELETEPVVVQCEEPI